MEPAIVFSAGFVIGGVIGVILGVIFCLDDEDYK